ncbi:MAG TPA: nitrous oxide-stimulated promoter family protein [Tissierellaceae bacterium]|jgi:hypothetical protein|nr:nitrous oxide-stimulated promoter family protein [Tissierellaceae bacterium]
MDANTSSKKITREKEIVSLMIDLYFKGSKNSLAYGEYMDLRDYCLKKLDSCAYGEGKPFCSSCKIHCYDEVHREKIRSVMGYSAPRMLFYHPIMMIRHTLTSLKKS